LIFYVIHKDDSNALVDCTEANISYQKFPSYKKSNNKRKQSRTSKCHKNSTTNVWDQHYAALFLYREKEKANDFNVPLNYILQYTEEDGSMKVLQLGRWLAEQKSIFLGINNNKKEKLSWTRKSMLQQMVEEGQLWCD